MKPGLTVAENLRFWGAPDAIGRALAAVDLLRLADLPARMLSAGQKRRLALARLALSEAAIWLLDEPTLGLDTASVGALRRAARRPSRPRRPGHGRHPSAAAASGGRRIRAGMTGMRFFDTFVTADFLNMLLSLGTGFVLGTLIGAERQYRQRTAGLRTNVLVCVGAAGFVDLGMALGGADGAVRVIAYVVSGIGFLGAGVIMKEGMKVRGLNTAATLWSSAAVGCFAGAHLPAQAMALTVVILMVNTLLRPLVNAINRIPFDERVTEATYTVRVRTVSDDPDLRDSVADALDAARFPVAELEVLQAGDGAEIVATLVNTSVQPAELDEVVTRLGRLPGARHASWDASTAE